MASFAGVTFEEDGKTTSRFGRKEINTYLRPPGGTRVVKQSAQQREDTMGLAVWITQSEYTSLLAKVGTVATLTWSGGTRRCNLDAISDAKEIFDSGELSATLQFTGL